MLRVENVKQDNKTGKRSSIVSAFSCFDPWPERWPVIMSQEGFPAPPPHDLQAGERWPLPISVSAGAECASMVLQ